MTVFSRKWFVTAITTLLVWVVATAVNHWGLKLSSFDSTSITGAIAIVAGAGAGYLTTESAKFVAWFNAHNL